VVKALKFFISHPSSDLCTSSRLTNALNMNSSHSPTKFSRPANLTTYTIISGRSTYRTRSSSTVTLGRPSVSSLLQSTNRSFSYASPYLWNQLPSSFRQPHSVHSPPDSPYPVHPDLKLISFTNPFFHSHSYSFRYAFTDLEPVLN